MNKVGRLYAPIIENCKEAFTKHKGNISNLRELADMLGVTTATLNTSMCRRNTRPQPITTVRRKRHGFTQYYLKREFIAWYREKQNG